MSRSNKARHGRLCKYSKDTFWSSANQKRAWRTRKQIETQRERTRAKALLREEMP